MGELTSRNLHFGGDVKLYSVSQVLNGTFDVCRGSNHVLLTGEFRQCRVQVGGRCRTSNECNFSSLPQGGNTPPPWLRE